MEYDRAIHDPNTTVPCARRAPHHLDRKRHHSPSRKEPPMNRPAFLPMPAGRLARAAVAAAGLALAAAVVPAGAAPAVAAAGAAAATTAAAPRGTWGTAT